ncbi:MAG: thiolase domain-containing protein [Anaerolineales bacterium]|nr:thiolase domain-containing protein [Anaerolineales bacterium]
MSEIIIAGIGQTEVGEHYDISLRDLALLAIEAALKDSARLRPDVLFVGNMIAPIASRQAHLGALIADYVGMVGIEASVVEAGGASGAAALRMGYFAVASGEAEVALVVGVEKVTDQLGPTAEANQMLGTDSDYEAVQGLTPNAQAALLMRRYIHEYQVPRQAFAAFPIIAHANGNHNPNAMFRSTLSPETYARAEIVSDPLNIFDVAPVADGAAAILLTRTELLPHTFSHKLVRISASSMATDRLALHDRSDPLAFEAARASAEKAYRQAGISAQDINLFELYDSYSVIAALSLEAAGFAPRGEGCKLAENSTQPSVLSLQGSLPIATFGGLKARGNPGGATGVYQAVEATIQLRGQAGENQVPGARRALIQALGGPASTAVTHILET